MTARVFFFERCYYGSGEEKVTQLIVLTNDKNASHLGWVDLGGGYERPGKKLFQNGINNLFHELENNGLYGSFPA
jgi:hypothetical protein